MTAKMSDRHEEATVGATVIVRGRPNYTAVIEKDRRGRLTVRPTPGQNMTTRARSVWRRQIISVGGSVGE